MLSKELAMEESISICRDYNIDIDTAMELVLESSLYDFEEDVATESLLGKSMGFGHRLLSGIMRICSFIANAIRTMIAKLTKKDDKRNKALGKIDNSIGSYIKRSAELIADDVVKMCEKCSKCVNDMTKVVGTAHDRVSDPDDGEPGMDLGYKFEKTPSEIKNSMNKINDRFDYLRSYSSKMENKYREGKASLIFIETSISEIIDKETSDKLVQKLSDIDKETRMLTETLKDLVTAIEKFNKDKTKEDQKQREFVDSWAKRSNEYISTIASTISTMNTVILSKGLRMPKTSREEIIKNKKQASNN